ncbi:MAG: MlaA family lipoprotein [Rhodovulum sp.]
MACLVLAALAGCAAPIPSGINDPHEAQNRAVHRENVALDRSLVRPVATAYGRSVPGPIRAGLSNFSSNLSLPGAVINSLLQLRPGDAVQNTTRFLINSTIGIGGLLDPATPMGATEIETGFGETLHVWGVREGDYVELPILGPSTERDAVGRIVDLAFDPLGLVSLSSDGRYALASVKAAAGVDARYENGEVIDSILYESADSYAQARQIYLQNRRFQLGRGATPDYFDPYEDPYADPAQ